MEDKKTVLSVKNLGVKLMLIVGVLFFGVSGVRASEKRILLFYGNGCPHCVQVDEYFKVEGMYDKYEIERKEIYGDRENASLFNLMMEGAGIPVKERGVPAMVMGKAVLMGDKPIIEGFEQMVEKYMSGEEETASQPMDAGGQVKTDLTWVAVIGASLVDAINPCAFAVLLILITTILSSGDGKKALKSGLMFASSIFISYFLMGMGLYKALEMGGWSQVFYKIVGWLAVMLGLMNLKDYWWYGKGVLMEVPMSWRPKLKKILGSVTNPWGAFGVGFVVSLILLPCTSGPYVVVLGMLAERVEWMRSVGYLALYNLVFVLPMILITIGVYKGLDPAKAEKLRKNNLKILHLVAGVLMLGMGVVILTGMI